MCAGNIATRILVDFPSDRQYLGLHVRTGRVSPSKASETHISLFDRRSKLKLFKTKSNGLGHALTLYLSDAWNQLDALCVLMYVISIALELLNTKLTLNAAR